MDLSIVVPVYNEEENVAPLHRKIVKVCRQLGKSFEIIFINDGSKDNTLKAYKKIIKGFVDLISVWFWQCLGWRHLGRCF